MAPLTGETIISAISLKIRSSFSTQEISNIYKNKPLQGMKTPSVFIHQINVNDENQMRNSSNRQYILDVRVHPSSHEKRVYSWLNNISERMRSVLNKIVVDNKPLKYNSIECKIEDDVLHCIVYYSFRVIDIHDDGTAQVKMKDLKDRERVI